MIHAYAEHKKFDSVFNTQQQAGLEAGLSEMAELVRTHVARFRAAFQNIEITKKLPESWRNPSRK